MPGALADFSSDSAASWASGRHTGRVAGRGNVSTAHLPPLPDLIPLPGSTGTCKAVQGPPKTPPTWKAPAVSTTPTNATPVYNLRPPAASSLWECKSSGAVLSRTELCNISVVSALTGQLLATLALPRTAAVATLKIEIEKVTGHSTFQIRFVSDDCTIEGWPAKDFDSLETVIGDASTITLSLLLSQQHDAPDLALPFDAREREYLPASGSPDDAIGLSRWRYLRPQEDDKKLTK